MSCALPEETGGGVRAADSQAAALYADLDNGLHAMAQPLTILRGALGALAMFKAVSSEHVRYLEMSTRELERLCDMMVALQGLLETALFPFDCKAVDLGEIIEPVLEEMEAKGPIEAAHPPASIRVICHAERTGQALRSAFATAASLAAPGSLLKLAIDAHVDHVNLIVQAESASRKQFGSAERLALSLIEAILRSQHGRAEYSEDPLQIALRLPVQHTDEHGAGIIPRRSYENLVPTWHGTS
jgi:hypothetical protein